MISVIDSPSYTTINNTEVVQRLARAIMLSCGQFSLLLACCNSTSERLSILSVLKEFSRNQIREVVLPPEASTLYTTLVKELGNSQPEVIVVLGLESVQAIDQLIISTNLMRDEFAKRFRAPLVLWVNEDILRKLVRLAPDLKNWAASTFRFSDQLAVTS